jgi:hypothetical protein|tara:strand:- start:223 stop:576 length:354 start_codon:yes stop_codon:yes gene_type:complete
MFVEQQIIQLQLVVEDQQEHHLEVELEEMEMIHHLVQLHQQVVVAVQGVVLFVEEMEVQVVEHTDVILLDQEILLQQIPLKEMTVEMLAIELLEAVVEQEQPLVVVQPMSLVLVEQV